MGNCNIDHSVNDVKKKLASQEEFLPNDIAKGLEEALTDNVPQQSLNEVFHLLKKYDLASEAERKERDQKLVNYIK